MAYNNKNVQKHFYLQNNRLWTDTIKHVSTEDKNKNYDVILTYQATRISDRRSFKGTIIMAPSWEKNKGQMAKSIDIKDPHSITN